MISYYQRWQQESQCDAQLRNGKHLAFNKNVNQMHEIMEMVREIKTAPYNIVRVAVCMYRQIGDSQTLCESQ